MMSSPLRSVPPTTHIRLLAIVGLLLAFGLRLHHLGAESLWYDETVSVFLAQQSIPDLIAHTARDIHPPGYYVLLQLWGQLTQPTLATGLEFLYAWPSLFWGILLLPLIYALGRRFLHAHIAVTALWLAAVNPYHIWYSQEVRMYTLGALLGLLCLWAASSQWHTSSPNRKQQSSIGNSLFLYALVAAGGLYTLYYFAFLLIALNLLVFWHHFANRQSPIAKLRALLPWVSANVLVLLLWSPWLPVFWRQTTEPPVPPWRGALDLPSAIQESLAALLTGQSPPLGLLWPWALLAAILLIPVVIAPLASNRHERRLLGFIFVPLLLILLISLTITPLYHIRYFFTYAAAGVLLIAVGLERIAGRWRWLHAILIGGILALNGWGLGEFWTNPLYLADDHRAAARALAAAWRPGDAILVNAGWAYTALAVYWPTTPSAAGTQPPHAPVRVRLLDYTNNAPPSNKETPRMLLGGAVDGLASLGWGLAASDFYPITRTETAEALAQITAHHPRIWHYRLYDTVSDPDGFVRAWLESHTSQQMDQPYPGRDFLRVQRFDTSALVDPALCPQESQPSLRFGSDLLLRGAWYTPAPQAGSTLYAVLCWTVGEGVEVENLRTSLRLYRGDRENGELVAQKDDAPFSALATRTNTQTALALPIPQATPLGSYRLELIVYDGLTGEPLPIDSSQAIFGQRWPLADPFRLGPQP